MECLGILCVIYSSCFHDIVFVWVKVKCVDKKKKKIGRDKKAIVRLYLQLYDIYSFTTFDSKKDTFFQSFEQIVDHLSPTL